MYAFLELTIYKDGFVPLRPLGDAQSESKRLLKFITLYQYQCNMTLQVSNRSHWPICIDGHAGIDIESRDQKIEYLVGIRGDLSMERMLAVNYSFQVYVATRDPVPQIFKSTNNTHVIETVIVPNDYADFSRNSYGQQTLNTLLKEKGHKHLDLLRLASTSSSVHLWEILHFMIYDNLLLDVKQLHIAMYIDKIDEDYLYNWYRALWELFYKAGFRLYHTTAADSLCLQVTMMESCLYYLSWVRNPGPKAFILHPPADDGTAGLEEDRLLGYVMDPQMECKQQVIGGQSEQQQLQFTTPNQPQWQVCYDSIYELFRKPCNVLRFRSENDYVLEGRLLKEGCSVHTFVPVFDDVDGPILQYRMHSHYPTGKRKGQRSEELLIEELIHKLSNYGHIALLELDVQDREWEVIGAILDGGILENVTQVVAEMTMTDVSRGHHSTVLRHRYSELRRIETQGFTLFHSSPSFGRAYNMSPKRHLSSGKSCCYKLGFIKRHHFTR